MTMKTYSSGEFVQVSSEKMSDVETSKRDLNALIDRWSDKGIEPEIAIKTLLFFAHNLSFTMTTQPEMALGLIQDSLDKMVERHVDDEDFKSTYYGFYYRGKQTH